MKYTRVIILVGIALAACLVRPIKATSGTVNPGATERPAPAASGASSAATPASVKSVELWPGSGTHRFELGDQLLVKVDHLSTLAKTDDQCKRQMVLFLDRLPVEGLAPTSCNVTTGEIVFRLVRGDATTATAWSTLVGSSGSEKKLDVSVGLKGSDPIESQAHDLSFRTYAPTLWGYLPALVLLILVACLARSGLLRDSVPEVNDVKKRPYSLSRCQLTGWLILIVGAFCLVWISTGEIPAMTPQLLALLGVTAGTAVGSLTITQAKNDQRIADRQAANLAAVAVPPIPALPPVPPVPEHSHFLFDILSEGGALSTIRLQHAVWTLVLWVLFVLSVYRTFGVLDFDKTLLGLMGISALAYGSAKLGEEPKKP